MCRVLSGENDNVPISLAYPKRQAQASDRGEGMKAGLSSPTLGVKMGPLVNGGVVKMRSIHVTRKLLPR